MPAKIPATVVTGFLGAGKTTLIRHMLQNAEGKKIALIINEFGDLGVDGDILKGCGEETCTEDDIVELSNGCICCTVADDFIPTMEQLLSREDKPDHEGRQWDPCTLHPPADHAEGQHHADVEPAPTQRVGAPNAGDEHQWPKDALRDGGELGDPACAQQHQRTHHHVGHQHRPDDRVHRLGVLSE